jgi:Tfp pilus assembly protein PilF
MLPPLVFAVLMVCAFWMTIGQPENMTPKDQDNGNTPSKQSVGFDPEVVRHAMALEPGRLMHEGKIVQAKKKANEYAAKYPHDLLSTLCAGNVICQYGDKDEGFRLLKKAVALAPRSRYVRMNLAEKLSADRKYDEAITQFNLITGGYPRWAKPHLALAMIYEATEQPQLAAEEYKTALDCDPNNANNGTIRKQRALALAHASDDKLGLEEYVRGCAEELNFKGMPADIKLSSENWGSLDRAEHEYRRELENDPDNPLVKLRLARIMIYRNQTQEARTLLTEAGKKAPSNVEIHRNLAVVLQKLGESNLALAEFRRSNLLEKSQAKAKEESEDKE